MLLAVPVMKKVQRQQGRKATRTRIVAAALELFARDGFDQTTVRRIAAECDLTDAALYYHFASKDDILEAVLQECWQEQHLWQVNVLPAYGAVSPATIDMIVDWTLDGIARNATVMRLVARRCLAGDERAVKIRATRQERWRQAVRRRLVGGFAPEDLDVAVETLRTLMVSVGMEVQIGRPEDACAALDEPAFRERVRGLARRALPLDRLRSAQANSA